MTAAAIASSSASSPRRTSVDPVSSTCIVDSSVAVAAVNMNKLILTRATGTPTLGAASASPPAANIQLPYGVLNNTQPRTKVRPAHHHIDILSPTGAPLNIVTR